MTFFIIHCMVETAEPPQARSAWMLTALLEEGVKIHHPRESWSWREAASSLSRADRRAS